MPAHHNQKTTQQDPITKARKAGLYREQEERAAHRNDWMYEANNE
jgi:hypothetical protein